MIWWDWNRWEQEIDWMAMNGINLALAFTGQELIWYKLFKLYNLDDDDIYSFFSGPGFLAWNRMGNVKGFGGKLDFNWMNNQYELGKKIINRMRELNIKTVLPAFAGHLPSGFKLKYPNSNVILSPNWGSFDTQYCCVDFLDPSDEY